MAEVGGRARVRALAIAEGVGGIGEVDHEVVEALRGRVPHDLRIAQLADREQRERPEVALVDHPRVSAVDPVPHVDQLDVAVRPHGTRWVGGSEISLCLPVPAGADRHLQQRASV